MATKANGNGFRDDEIVSMSHWDKREKKWIQTAYPKIGGRLRLAHEGNESLSITTTIVRYDGEIAVINAVAETVKGAFHGVGMSSLERDQKIAPAILELAETRAIARALRFAGYGVEFCSAEEVSHLNGIEDEPPADPPSEEKEEPPKQAAGNGDGRSQPANNGKARRISNRQLNYIINLGKSIGMNSRDIDKETEEEYGVPLSELSGKDASKYIEALKEEGATSF